MNSTYRMLGSSRPAVHNTLSRTRHRQHTLALSLHRQIVEALDTVETTTPARVEFDPNDVPDMPQLGEFDAGTPEAAAARAAGQAWKTAYADALRVQREHQAGEDLRQAWLTAADLLADLADLRPDDATFALGQRWANLRPTGAVPPDKIIKAMNPLLAARGRIAA